MKIIHNIADLAGHEGGTLVPTMGALHEGHASLIKKAICYNRPTIVSVFVNPTQFGPNDDFKKYPRQLDKDIQMAKESGADILFAPTIKSIYPKRFSITPEPLPLVATKPNLEDLYRPEHFQGVLQVVSRLFKIVLPENAVFGEKDYQQLRVIEDSNYKNMLTNKPITIIRSKTMRENDGLALSSRNKFLTAEQRKIAIKIQKGLKISTQYITPKEAEIAMKIYFEKASIKTEYAVIRDSKKLWALPERGAKGRALVALKIGSTRLIDNLEWPSK